MSEMMADIEVKKEIISSDESQKEMICCVEIQESKSTTKSKVILTVNHFIDLNQMIKSENFTIGSNNEWYIQLDPNFIKNGVKYLGVYLYLAKSNDTIVRAKHWPYLKNNRNGKRICKISENIDEYICGHGWGYDDFIARHELIDNNQELLPNNQLIIGLDIEVFNQIYRKDFDFKDMLNSGELSDFSLIVEGNKFSIHRIVLSSRSSVFKTLFTIDLKDKDINELELKDFRSDVFEEFLKFLYLGKLDKLSEMVEELLQISDFYNVNHLKSICEDFLCSNISVENAIKRVLIGDKYKASKLVFKCIKFIAKHMETIRSSQSNEWFSFLKSPDSHHLIDRIFGVITDNSPKLNKHNLAKKQKTSH